MRVRETERDEWECAVWISLGAVIDEIRISIDLNNKNKYIRCHWDSNLQH